jgi:hypothetical protein
MEDAKALTSQHKNAVDGKILAYDPSITAKRNCNNLVLWRVLLEDFAT